MTKQMVIEHIQKVRQRYPELLLREATQASITALAGDISFISDAQLRAHILIDLIIAE